MSLYSTDTKNAADAPAQLSPAEKASSKRAEARHDEFNLWVVGVLAGATVYCYFTRDVKNDQLIQQVEPLLKMPKGHCGAVQVPG